MLQNLYAYRAIRGGVWEKTASSNGWYRMKGMTGQTPPNTEDFEDHRDAWPLVMVCAGSIFLTSVVAIVALAE